MRFLLILTFFTFTSTLLTAQLVGETENGLASYYSNEYQGAETAYGEYYDKTQLVAAHRLYPHNSVVKVRNVENNKTVNVRIIDKGPFIRGRIVELSERAAANLGMLGKETVQVELTLLSTPDQPGQVVATEATRPRIPETTVAPEPAPTTAERQPQLPETTPAPAPAPRTETPAATSTPPVQPRPAQTPPPAPTVSDEAVATVKATPVSNKTFIRNATFDPGVYKIELLKPAAGKFGVQVGSFKDMEGAMDKVAELQSKWFENILIERVSTGPGSVYKIILGPFETQKSASRYASDLKKRYKMDGFTVGI